MLIRRLTEADLDALWNIRLRSLQDNPEAFGSTYEETVVQGKESWRQRLHPNDDMFYLGAFTETLVGIVLFHREKNCKMRHKGSVHSVYVVPEKRGQGISKVLMQELIAQAKQLEGLEQLHLGVVTANLAASRLYRSLGFEVCGRLPGSLKLGEQYWDEELMMLHFLPGKGKAVTP